MTGACQEYSFIFASCETLTQNRPIGNNNLFGTVKENLSLLDVKRNVKEMIFVMLPDLHAQHTFKRCNIIKAYI